MDWKGHVLIAVLVAAALWKVLGVGLVEGLLLLPLVVFSALLPDADHKMSKGRTLLDYLVLVMALLPYITKPLALLEGGFISVLATYGAYSLFMLLFKPKHRGITHTLFAAATYATLIYLAMGSTASIFAFASYLSHLLADKSFRVL